jgi:hypothetical protein
VNRVVTFNREVMSVLADGMTETQEVEIILDSSTGKFHVALPDHVCTLLTVNQEIEADTLQSVVQQYETYCDAFSRRKLGKMPKPMLLIAQAGGAPIEEGLDVSVGLGMREVLVDFFEYGAVEAIYNRAPNDCIGARIPGDTLSAWMYTLMEDRPEIRAKYRELAASIKRADDILMQMTSVHGTTTGMENYFLSISYDSKQGEPAAETKTTEPATSDPAQPELPFSTPTDDDEEL